MPVYECTSIVSKQTFKELKLHLIRPRQKQSWVITITVLTALFVNAIIRQNMNIIYAFGFLLIISGISIILVIHQNVRFYSKKLWQTTKLDRCKFSVKFYSGSINVSNDDTGESATFLYEELSKCVQTNSCYALFTKNNQFVVVDRCEIDDVGKRDEFIAFLKEKCFGMKWRGIIYSNRT